MADPITGRTQLNSELIESAKGLAIPAALLASGANVFQVAATQLKFAALDKLLGPTALFAGGLLGVLSTIKKIVEETGILERGMRLIAATEQIEGKFTTLLKSATLAKQRIQDLYQFASNTPFRFDDVAEANRQLEALTNGALSGKAGMKLVGDAAAATGQAFSDTAEHVGKLYNALLSGRPLDRIIFQMQNTGLVTDVVAKQLENLEQAGAGFGEKWGVIETALRRNQGGMANQSKSLEALSTRLANAGDQLEKAFAAPFRDAQAKSIEVSIKATENVTPVLAEIGSDLAPLLNLTTTFKNSLTESTLATKAFATALGVAWQIGKVAFAGIGLASIGKLTTELGTAGKFIGGTLGSSAARIAAAKATGGGLARATGLFGEAAGALAPGGAGVSAAASFAAEAVAIKAATLAGIVHKEAMEAVGKSTGVAAVANYTASAAISVLGGAMNLTKRAALAMGAAVQSTFVALLTNPFTATLVAVGAAATGFLIWKRAVEAADKAYADLAEQIAATNKRLTEQAAAASTTDQWTKSINDLTDAYEKALDALQAFKDEQASKNRVAEAVKDFLVPGRASDRNASLDQLEGAASGLRRQRDSQIYRSVNTGLNDREKDQYRLEVQQREALRDQAFQQDYAVSDAETQNRLAEEHIALLRREAAEGKAAEATRDKFNRSVSGRDVIRNDAYLHDAQAAEARAQGQARALGLTDDQFADPASEAARRRTLAAATKALPVTAGLGQDAERSRRDEAVSNYLKQAAALDEINAAMTRQKNLLEVIRATRRGSDSEIVRNLQEQADLIEDTRRHPAAAGAPDPRAAQLVALQKRAVEINESIGTFRGKETEAAQEDSALVQAKKTQALKELEISLDKEIAEARQKGLQTASLEMEKQIKLLEKQRDLATDRPQERRAIDAQLAAIRGNQAQFRGEAALDREKNRLLVKGNADGALAVDDFRARRDLINQYLANGLTADQAKKDFTQSIAARDLGGPRVAVDPLQAVGGGGGFSGAGAILENSRRQTVLTEIMVQKLTQIAEGAARGDNGID